MVCCCWMCLCSGANANGIFHVFLFLRQQRNRSSNSKRFHVILFVVVGIARIDWLFCVGALLAKKIYTIRTRKSTILSSVDSVQPTGCIMVTSCDDCVAKQNMNPYILHRHIERERYRHNKCISTLLNSPLMRLSRLLSYSCK